MGSLPDWQLNWGRLLIPSGLGIFYKVRKRLDRPLEGSWRSHCLAGHLVLLRHELRLILEHHLLTLTLTLTVGAWMEQCHFSSQGLGPYFLSSLLVLRQHSQTWPGPRVL